MSPPAIPTTPTTSADLQKRTAVTAADALARADFIADMRALADMLQANPGLPVGAFSSFEVVYFPPSGSDERAFAQIAGIGQVLGAMPVWEGEHYTVQRRVGRACYRAVAIPERARARYRAWLTYADHVRPH